MGDLAPRVNVLEISGRIAAKTVLGSVPVAGPLLAAVIDEIMPAIRAERLGGFAQALDDRVRHVTLDVLNERMGERDRYDLLEDGMWQASRASSQTRLEQIAHIVANSLTADESRALDRRYLLRLLGELNDVEVLVLYSYRVNDSGEEQDQFWARHREAIEYRPACYGDSQDVIDRAAVRNDYENHLLRLGLLEERYTKLYNKPIEFDHHGQPKGIHRQLSPLGRFLLREIGEFAGREQ